MVTLKTLDSSIISLIILSFIYMNAYNRSEKIFINYKLFIELVRTNMVLIIIDIFSWVFNGVPGTLNMIFNRGFNIMLYMVEPVAAMLWVLYTSYQIFKDDNRIEKGKHLFMFFLVINGGASVLSLFTGWFFSIDAGNLYHRGNYYWIHVVFCYSLLAYSFITILVNRGKLEKKYFISLLLFFLPMSVGTTFQVLFYGVSYTWTGMMLSLLIIYFNIQNRGLNTDYLTGLYNRRQLDGYIKAKIRSSTERKSFSAILIDLNEFKKINDNFGHDIGDEALKNAVEIIRKSLRQNDFVARFGGDEFVVIMDIHCYQMLKQTVKRIKDNAEKFNKDNEKPYKIGFSVGYDIYDYKAKMNVDDFFNHIDRLMYNDKKSIPY